MFSKITKNDQLDIINLRDMNSSPELIEKIKNFARNNLIILALAFLGLIFLGIGLIQFLGQRESEISFESGEEISGEKREKGSLFVDVSGAVLKPGVYGLKVDARIQDALIAAGGLSDEADRDYIAKNINLAQKLQDGVKLYVPRVSEAGGSVGIAGVSVQEKLKVNINTATGSELDILWGVGPATSEKIIEGRPYSTIEELLTKKAVTQRVFERIKEQITVY